MRGEVFAEVAKAGEVGEARGVSCCEDMLSAGEVRYSLRSKAGVVLSISKVELLTLLLPPMSLGKICSWLARKQSMSSIVSRRYELLSSKLVKAGAMVIVEVLTAEVSPKLGLNESLVPDDATRVVEVELSPPPKRRKSLLKSKDSPKTSL